MNCRTYELYDENEYFIKFLNIHPILIYSNKLIDIKKLEYQTYLLKLLKNNTITLDELKKKYNNILKIENELKYKLCIIKELNKKIENNHNTQLIELFNHNIN